LGDRTTGRNSIRDQGTLEQQLSSFRETAFSFSPPAILESARPADSVRARRPCWADVPFCWQPGEFWRPLAASRNWLDIHLLSTERAAKILGVDGESAEARCGISDVYRSIQAFMGGLFINYFNDFGRSGSVVEARLLTEPTFEPAQFYCVTTAVNVPLTALTKFESRDGPEFTMRYKSTGRTDQWQRRPSYSQNKHGGLEDSQQTMPARWI